jgi:signal transduction histidine kinase
MIAMIGRWAPASEEVGGSLGWVGLAAGIVSCGTALALGLAAGWSAAHILGYVVVALVFLALTQAYRLPLLRRLIIRPWVYLLVAGLVCLVLQALSQDPYLQPMAFVIPLVYAVLAYELRGALLTIAGYLLLMMLGLWLGNVYMPQGLVLPMIGYGSMMLFLVGFVRLMVAQASARQRADELASELRRERDALARLADENARLYAQAELSATLAERNRLARELHDTIAQGLTAVTMQLDAAQRSWERDPGRSRARLTRAHELARETLDDVRRSVWTLAAPLVDGQTLPAALDEQVARLAGRSGLVVRYQHFGPPPNISHAAATQLLRIVQEALHNVEKHAHATTVEVGSATSEAEVSVWVQDDGRGFDPEAVRASDTGGFGLLSLYERARLANGMLEVQSTPGTGTRIRVVVASSQAHAIKEIER